MLRLTGKYFVLITFLMGEVVRMAIVENSWLTGGSNGIFYGAPALSRSCSPTGPTTILPWPLPCSASGSARACSPREFGRAMDPIREGERLAECSGVPVIRFKVTVFVIACALAGMAGSLQAHYIRSSGRKPIRASSR